MNIGEDKSLEELAEDEQKDVKDSRDRNRWILGLGLALFSYLILANELFNLAFEIPEYGFRLDSGWFLPAMLLTALGMGVAILVAKPFYLLF